MAIFTWLLGVFVSPRGLDSREANLARQAVRTERQAVGTPLKAQPHGEGDRTCAIQDVTASMIEREIFEELGW